MFIECCSNFMLSVTIAWYFMVAFTHSPLHSWQHMLYASDVPDRYVYKELSWLKGLWAVWTRTKGSKKSVPSILLGWVRKSLTEESTREIWSCRMKVLESIRGTIRKNISGRMKSLCKEWNNEACSGNCTQFHILEESQPPQILVSEKLNLNLALAFTTCVIWIKSLSYSIPQFHSLEKWE